MARATVSNGDLGSMGKMRRRIQLHHRHDITVLPLADKRPLSDFDRYQEIAREALREAEESRKERPLDDYFLDRVTED